MADDLSVLAPESVVVEYGGERLEIQPLTIGQLPRLVRKCKPIVEALMRFDDADGLGDAETISILLGLVDSHGEQLAEAVAIATGREPHFIAKGSLDDFVNLAFRVIEVNRDFFARRLVPLLQGLKKPGSGNGPTLSSS